MNLVYSEATKKFIDPNIVAKFGMDVCTVFRDCMIFGAELYIKKAIELTEVSYQKKRDKYLENKEKNV